MRTAPGPLSQESTASRRVAGVPLSLLADSCRSSQVGLGIDLFDSLKGLSRYGFLDHSRHLWIELGWYAHVRTSAMHQRVHSLLDYRTRFLLPPSLPEILPSSGVIEQRRWLQLFPRTCFAATEIRP